MRPFVCAFVLLAVACTTPARHSKAPSAPAATANAAPAADSSARPDIVCFMERPIGSNIAKKVCYRQEELDAASDAARQTLREAAQKPPPQPKGQ